MNFAASDVDGLMQEALDKVTGQIRTADRVLFMLQEGRQLAIKAAHGGRPGREVPVEKVSRAILRRVRRTGRTLFLSDALADNGLGTRQSIQEIGQRSVICAPLKANGRVVGLLYADTVSLIAAFTPAHLQWVNQMTESLNESLEPLIPERLDTMVDETVFSEDDFDDAVETLIPKHVERAPPTPNFHSAEADLLFAADKKPFARLKAAAKAKREPSMRLMDLAIFYRMLASMLTAGINVHRALDILGELGTATSAVSRQLHSDVCGGNRLSVSMGRFPQTFSPVQRSLIKVGEETGCLDILALSLAEHVEGRMHMKNKMVAALTYPVLVAGICLLGCILAPPLFLNDFFVTLTATGIPLPLLTKFVMAVAAAVGSPALWLLLIGGVWALHLGWKRVRRNPPFARKFEQAVLRVPVLGPIRQAFFLLDFMHTLALQLEAGLRLDKSLLLSASVSGNSYLQEQTEWVVEHVKAGSSLSFSLHRAKVFPRTVIEFISLGEETGKMAQSCRFAEALLRERAETALETAETLMEPLAICLVGLLVGVVALGCMLPLVRMFDAFL